MISQTAEYALRAAVLLGSAPQVALPAHEIARATRIPASYLTKILSLLSRAGVVRGQRGPNGGFVIGRAPEAVSVLEVIRAVEPWAGLDRCPLGLPEHSGQLCRLHGHLARAFRDIERAFGTTMLSELLPRGSEGDCAFPASVRPRAAGTDDRTLAPTPARRRTIATRSPASGRRRRGGSTRDA